MTMAHVTENKTRTKQVFLGFDSKKIKDDFSEMGSYLAIVG